MSRVLSLAGFQVTLIGRFWVTPEVRIFRSPSAFVSKPRADVAILQGKQRAERQTEGFGDAVGAITLQ